MNNEPTKNSRPELESKTFPAMTTRDIAALAQSDNLDDNKLAARLSKRLVLAVKQSLGTITAEQVADLDALVCVTDQELARI